MLTILKRFLWDETAAKGYLRFLLLAGGLAIAALPAEVVGELPVWARVGGVVVGALAGLIRAGEPNPK